MTACLPLWWDPSSWWHYVISRQYFHSVGYWSSNYLLWAYQDSLFVFSDFLSFYLAHLSLAHTFLLRDVHFCMPLWLMVLWVFLLFSFDPWLRFIGVVLQHTIHDLFFPVFIHRILLHLGLKDFPAFEPVHIIAPIGATFLRQRAAQMKASSKHPRVESFSGVASHPPSSGDPTVEEFVDPAAAVDPPPSTSSDSSIRNMLDTVMTVQATHG